MKKRITLLFLAALFLFSAITSSAQEDMIRLRNYIKEDSTIATGGTEIFEYNGKTFLISVASVVVSSKSEAQCKTVGNAKAKKEMLAYINGEDITSSTILTNSETITDDIDGRHVECSQEYVEQIKASVIGTISQFTPLEGWYSPDRSVYYFSIYKIL